MRSAAAWNLLAILGVMLLVPVALAVAGFAVSAAICPFVMLVAVCTMERPNELIDTIVIPTIFGVVGYFVFGCAALYTWAFRKERAAAKARKLEIEQAALKPMRRRRRRVVEDQPEPNHGWGQALLAIGVAFFPAWLVLIFVPKFPKRHRITAATLLLVSLGLGLVLILTKAGADYP